MNSKLYLSCVVGCVAVCSMGNLRFELTSHWNLQEVLSRVYRTGFLNCNKCCSIKCGGSVSMGNMNGNLRCVEKTLGISRESLFRCVGK